MNQIQMLPTNQDNYCYVVHLGSTTVVVDPGDAQPVLQYIEQHGCTLSVILNTHMHQDHCHGNEELKRVTGCIIIGPDKRIPAVDYILAEEEPLAQVTCDVSANVKDAIQVIYTPGHTSADCCYYLPATKTFPGALFSGDTLFSGGCGRIFEGTMEDMFNSLQRLKALPLETLLYCGHEYTLDNYRFAEYVEPNSVVVRNKLRDVQLQRERGEVTLPVRLADELVTNPFLRTGDCALRQALRLEDASELEVFTELRKRKNRF
ncbi:MAG: hydroxyacylglutathione hydrolase [Deltaproteobacteria bacterium]|nr:hydroxyacylglutathione hydrolase [Deltaproteobacteria bacterium]